MVEMTRERLRWAAGRSRQVLAEEGLVSFAVRARDFTRYRITRGGLGSGGGHRLDRTPLTYSQAVQWPPSVSIVGMRELPQCFRYRQLQKVQAARDLGVPLILADPRNFPDATSRMQLARVLIVYRVPWSEGLAHLVSDARRLGVPVVYELDDIVHRPQLVATNPNLDSVPMHLRRSVEHGAHEYLRALRLADHVIASTSPLAEDMQREVGGRAWVIENGIDEEMLNVMKGIEIDRGAGRLRDSDDGRVVILYGSGSRAHDADFQLAAPALAEVMRSDSRVHLVLVGPVRLPNELTPLHGRVTRHEELPFPEYLRTLAQADVTISPLLDVAFNRFKSQVKYLEAGLTGVPLIASPTVYRDYVRPGETALLADGSAEWSAALRLLIDDPGARRALAASAREHVATWEVTETPSRQFARFVEEVCAP